jgi:hypothetical protein
MNNLVLSLFCLATSLLGFTYARRCQKNSQACVNRFISQFGAPQSVFAIFYTGEVEKAKKAFLENENLRRKYVIEQYVNALAILIAGILLLFVEL